MKRLAVVLACLFALAPAAAPAKPKMYVSFLWHMHQPIYWPYESVKTTADAGRYGFDLYATFTDRSGPYTSWPVDAVQAGRDAGLAHFGTQVSYSGSLMENLRALEAAGVAFKGWKNRWSEAAAWKTELGNPAVDLVRFGYHHPLMGLVSGGDIGRQLALHQWAQQAWVNPAYGTSKGLFPPEDAFAPWMIPSLAAAGIEWVIVDNIHFDRACVDYPYSKGSNLYPPNAADQRNAPKVDWVQLNGIWAGSKVSAPWGYQPHRVRYVDPETGAETRVVAVPAGRYEGNEDGRGGFGALQYEAVFSQYEQFNTDDAHPMLIVLHHDGDNYGGGTDGYYHGNFGNFLQWLKDKSDRFEETTIQDYLDRFPPAEDDVIHVEPGGWSGAENGDPEFKKWNGDPDKATGYSPDHNSWAVMTAAANRVATAQANRPEPSVSDVVAGTGDAMAKAWHFYLNGQTSCYWYWDNAENGKWDSHPTRAANLALEQADAVLSGAFQDPVPPSIYLPQREPYNPGGLEWADKPEASDFTVWTYVHDASGLASVSLRWRKDADGAVGVDDERYSAGGWEGLPMAATAEPSKTDPAPKAKADRYEAKVTGVADALVHYFVEAVDAKGNTGRSPIQHVWVGVKTGGTGPGPTGPWTPASPCAKDAVTVTAAKAGFLHWGVNGWKAPIEAYRPAGSTMWTDGIAVETPLVKAGDAWQAVVGPFDDPSQPVTEVDFVIHGADGAWDKNQVIPIAATCAAPPEPGPEPVPDAAEEALPDGGPGADLAVDPGAGADAIGDGTAGGDGTLPPADARTDAAGDAGDTGKDAARSDGGPGNDLVPGGDVQSGSGCTAANRPAALPWAAPAVLLAALLRASRRRSRT